MGSISRRELGALLLAGACQGQKPIDDWAVPYVQAFWSRVKPTQPTADRTDIVIPGSVIVFKKSGIILYSIRDRFPSTNKFVNGEIKPEFPNIAARRIEEGTARKFVAGETVWITRMLILPKGSGLELEFLSDPYEDARFYGTVEYPFPKAAPRPTPAEFLAQVSQVIGLKKNAPAPAADTAAPEPTPVPEPVPAPAAPPISIELGQTSDQVIAALGQPLRIANANGRQIYFYKDMKVTLTAGKVSDVE